FEIRFEISLCKFFGFEILRFFNNFRSGISNAPRLPGSWFDRRVVTGFLKMDSPNKPAYGLLGVETRNLQLLLKFPVNSLFLYMGIAKTRNPCGFSRSTKKIPCYFPC